MTARRLAAVAAALAVALAGCGGDEEGGGAGGPVKLNWYVFNDKSGSFADIAEGCSKRSGGRYEIDIQILPADANGQREQLVRRLAAEDDSIDLIAMDVIWTGEFAEAKWIRPFTGADRAQIARGTLKAPLETASYRGRLWAAPFNSNVQLLYYRTDLAKQPPQTWDEMIRVASRLPANQNKIEVQAAQYEGLTVWFNSLLVSAGGQVLANQDEAALGRPAVRALEVMKRLATSPAADPAISNQKEDTSFAQFAGGKAAFMVNYPDFFGQLEKEAKQLVSKVKLARYPGIEPGEPGRSTIGGVNLGISAYSRHPREAVDAVKCMHSTESQRILATKGGYPPSLAALYDDPEVLKGKPYFPLLRAALADAAVRPVSPAYNDISLAIQKTLSPPRDIEPRESEEELKEKIDKALESGGLI